MIAAFMHHHHHDSAATVPLLNGSDGPRAHPSSPSSLLAECQSLQSRHFDCTVALSASVAKLDSAKALVLALHAEQQELIEWRQRKRAEVRTLQEEGKKYYKLWKQAVAAAAAAVPAPLQSQSQPQPQLLAHAMMTRPRTARAALLPTPTALPVRALLRERAPRQPQDSGPAC